MPRVASTLAGSEAELPLAINDHPGRNKIPLPMGEGGREIGATSMTARPPDERYLIRPAPARYPDKFLLILMVPPIAAANETDFPRRPRNVRTDHSRNAPSPPPSGSISNRTVREEGATTPLRGPASRRGIQVRRNPCLP